MRRDPNGAHRVLPLLCLVATAALACGGTNTSVSGTGGTTGGAGTTGTAGTSGNAGTSGTAGTTGTAGTGGNAGTTGGAGGGGGTGGACAAASAGATCSSEGMVCGSCTDPCQFCNTLRCQSGHWQTQEAFPAQCFDCGGPGVRCELHTQYCKITTSHVGTSSACASLPAGCAPTASCACLSNPPLCSQTDGGAVTVTIQAP